MSNKDMKVLLAKLGDAYHDPEFVEEFHEAFFTFSPESKDKMEGKGHNAMKGLYARLSAAQEDRSGKGLADLEAVRKAHGPMTLSKTQYEMFAKSLGFIIAEKLKLTPEEKKSCLAALDSLADYMITGAHPEIFSQ